MKRLLAISDIHGNLDKFARLLELIEYNKDSDQLILLGDYVDRGPDSRAVLDKVIEPQQEGAITLLGNHEKMMIEAFSGDIQKLKRWYYNGGIKTLQNYGYVIEPDDSEYWYTTDEMPMPIEKNAEIRKHIDILEEFPYYFETDTHIFVHAGIQPGIPIEQTDPNTLVWIREDFIKHYNGDKTIVFGHTPAKYLHDCAEVYFGDNRIIGIDGGCAYDGRLNCLDVHNLQVYYID